MNTVTMRTMTSGMFQRWIKMADPGNTRDFNPALLQFVLSNPLVDVALVGMRDRAQVAANIATENDEPGRIDLRSLFNYYV